MKPEVVIIGAGPAGMSAALALQSAGACARVVDEQPAPGGQVYRAVDRVSTSFPEALKVLGADYAAGKKITDQFNSAKIAFSPATSVWDIAGGDAPRLGLVGGEGAEMVYPDYIVLANGAMERPTPFPGWTLPGVMGVGAAQTLLKDSGLVPQGRIVIAGTGPLVYLYASQLIAAGAPPVAILDTAPPRPPGRLWSPLLRAAAADWSAIAKGRKWLQQIRAASVQHVHDVTRWSALGDQKLEAMTYHQGATSVRLECDLLLVHDGVIPNTHLSMAADCRHHWNSLQHYWAAEVRVYGETSQPGISIAGDNADIAGADAAACRGRVVGLGVACRLGLITAEQLISQTAADRNRLQKIAVVRSFLDQFYRPLPAMQLPPDDDTIVCRCEEVTAGEIRQVAKAGCVGPNQGKAFTRCGMGPCMGRYCGNTVSQIIASARQQTVEQTGHYRIRPPVRPLSVGQLIDMR